MYFFLVRLLKNQRSWVLENWTWEIRSTTSTSKPTSRESSSRLSRCVWRHNLGNARFFQYVYYALANGPCVCVCARVRVCVCVNVFACRPADARVLTCPYLSPYFVSVPVIKGTSSYSWLLILHLFIVVCFLLLLTGINKTQNLLLCYPIVWHGRWIFLLYRVHPEVCINLLSMQWQ